MSLIDLATLAEGNYKGASFHYQTNEITGGRKKISHEYPGKKERFVEDNGGLEKKFSLTVWTDDNTSFGQRDALIEALENEDLGTLEFQTFSQEDVAAIDYTMRDEIKMAGVSQFTINFEKSSPQVFPSQLAGNKGFLANLKSKILGDSEAKFDSAFASVKNAKQKFDSATTNVKAAARKINAASKRVQAAGNSFSDFTTSINQVVSSVNSLVQSPAILANKINSALSNLQLAYDNSKDAFNVFKGMFGFSQEDQNADGNSQTQKDIKNNQNQLNNLINVGVLAIAYEAAANIDFADVDELNQVQSDLENGWNSLPETIDPDILKTLITMRIEAAKLFADLSIGLPNVIDYEVLNPTSLNVLVYQLYGSLDLKNTIRDLNNFRDTSAVSGTIKVLSNV